MEQLAKNIAVIAEAQPELAKKFKDFQPAKVICAGEGTNDLLADGQRFYNMDGHTACKAQVTWYLSKPSHYALTYTSADIAFARHQGVINQLNDKARSLGYPLKQPHCGTLVVFGGGIGMHLHYMLKKRQFSTIVLVEPDDEMLYHSLRYIDVDELSRYCQRNGGVFTIVQPNSRAQFVNQINTMAEKTSYGMFAEMGFFRHYETDLFNDIFNNIKAIRHQWISSWGFFDDEMLGLAHTLENARQQCQFFHKDSHSKLEIPVVLVGNGPSLDDDIHLLKQHKDKYLVVSCGTSMVPLLKEGIEPDIHVEMERSPKLYELNAPRLTEGVRKKTVFIALNTVAPKLTAAFEHTLIFSKANDLGTLMLSSSGNKDLPPLYFCNPTVTNLALSALIALGFEQFILLGCDYGYKDSEKHHASGSEYYEPDNMLASAKFSRELMVPGNFGGHVGTDRTFNLSRGNVELLLARNSSVNCVNCSDGANIKGTKTERFAQLITRLDSHMSSDRVFEYLSQAQFRPAKMSEKSFIAGADNALSIAAGLITQLSAKPKRKQLVGMLNRLTIKLDQSRNHSPEFFMYSGVARMFCIAITGHLNRIPQDHQGEYVDFASDCLKHFFEHCLNTLEQTLNIRTE